MSLAKRFLSPQLDTTKDSLHMKVLDERRVASRNTTPHKSINPCFNKVKKDEIIIAKTENGTPSVSFARIFSTLKTLSGKENSSSLSGQMMKNRNKKARPMQDIIGVENNNIQNLSDKARNRMHNICNVGIVQSKHFNRMKNNFENSERVNPLFADSQKNFKTPSMKNSTHHTSVGTEYKSARKIFLKKESYTKNAQNGVSAECVQIQSKSLEKKMNRNNSHPLKTSEALLPRNHNLSFKKQQHVETKISVVDRSIKKKRLGENNSENLSDCEVVEEKFFSTLAVYQKLISILIKIYNYTHQHENCSNLIQIFLEQGKQSRELEEFFIYPRRKAGAAIIMHTKVTLVFVLFLLNYVNILKYETELFSIFNKCLEGFSLILGWMKGLTKKDIGKSHKIDDIIIQIGSVSNQATQNSLIEVKCIESLVDLHQKMKSEIIDVVQTLYKTSEVAWKIEALFCDFENANMFQSLVKTFEIFEEMLKEAPRETRKEIREDEPQEPELTDSSFYYDQRDPNFIIQPLKAEKYLEAKAGHAPALTLVLDLDETLVHFEEKADGGEFLVRPYASEFILRMAEMFEIIVFTAAVKEYADWIIDRIDPGKLISARLYRNHTYFQNGTYIKDLSRLGRDLSKTIIVDNNIDNFQLQPENGIYIKTWIDDASDTALVQLSKILTLVSFKNAGDVRSYLSELSIKMNKKGKEEF